MAGLATVPKTHLCAVHEKSSAVAPDPFDEIDDGGEEALDGLHLVVVEMQRRVLELLAGMA